MCGVMVKCNREEEIIEAVARIEKSSLSAEEYIQRYGAPFSIAQFYRYRARLLKEGKEGIRDRRGEGNHRKLGKKEKMFLRGYIKDRPQVTLSQAQRVVSEEFGISVHFSTMSRVLRELGLVLESREREVVREAVKKEQVSCAGFELIAALAIHLGWTRHTARYLMDVIERQSTEPQPSDSLDKDGRNARGQFTKSYNQRSSVREMRFASIDKKRAMKDLRQMDIFETSMKNLERKALAVLALPLVTLNGEVRHVNTAIGNRLAGFCGYNYKQSTLDRFLRELKYSGVSEWLLGGQVKFWHERWSECGSELELPFLCYYIDSEYKASLVKAAGETKQGNYAGTSDGVFGTSICA